MSGCRQCGSLAINHGSHGRDGSDPELCDVCYWRKRAEELRAEVAALAEQDRKMREFVSKVSQQKPEKPDYWSSCSQCEYNASDAEDLLELPDLATPAINRIKAEAYREAAEICVAIEKDKWKSRSDGGTCVKTFGAIACANAIYAKADDIEKEAGK